MEFLRYPQVIRQLFNGGRFGPPLSFTSTSTCSWIGHPVSGLLHVTFVLFTLGFPAAPYLKYLTSLRTITRRTVLQKVPHRTYRALCACKHKVSGSLSLPSRGSFHLSLTVLCAIGHQNVFRLGGWSPLLPTGFLVSCGTLDTDGLLWISRTGLLPSSASLPNEFCYLRQCLMSVHNPDRP